MKHFIETEHHIETSKMVVGNHLIKRGVKYHENVNDLKSEFIPTPIFSYDTRLCSHDNWIGFRNHFCTGYQTQGVLLKFRADIDWKAAVLMPLFETETGKLDRIKLRDRQAAHNVLLL